MRRASHMSSGNVPGVNERLSAIIKALCIDEELAQSLRSRVQVVSGESALDVINTAAYDVMPSGKALDRILLANSMAEISGNSAHLAQIADKDDNAARLADLASRYRKSQTIADTLSDEDEDPQAAQELSHEPHDTEPATELDDVVDDDDISNVNNELEQLKLAHLEYQNSDYEITKHISLHQLDPLALVSLCETGSCTFTIPEAVFDVDFPGHYLRRIKSISLSIPYGMGPIGSYTSVNATLYLGSSKYRTDPAVKSNYAEDTQSEDPRFLTTRVPLSATGTSSWEESTQTLELNFHEERYRPFEGSGAISTWTLEFKSALAQFNHQNISDIVIHMQYTAVEGGRVLKQAAESAIKAALDTKESYALLNLRNEIRNSWASISTARKDSGRILSLPRIEDLVPFPVRQKRLVATGITVLSNVELPHGTVAADPTKKISPDVPPKDIKLAHGSSLIPNLKTLHGSTTEGLLVEGVWELKFEKGPPVEANRAWMLVTMKPVAEKGSP